jgi:lipoprotein signal peptidase
MVKEDFCPACLTIPLAFAGAGTAFGSHNKAKYKWAMWITIISVVLTIYFIYVKKCTTCKIKPY